MNYATVQSQGSLEAVANMMCPSVGLSVVVSDTAETGATNGKTIVIPSSALNTPKNRGFLDHEVGHALFTDMRAFLAYAKRSAWHKNTCNMLEDMRIEAKVRDMFPGARANLSVLSEELEKDAEKGGAVASYKNYEETVVAGTQQWLYAKTQEDEYGTYGKFRESIEAQFRRFPDGGDILREMERIAARVRGVKTQSEVEAICDDYHDLVRNWVKYQPDPPRQEQSEQSGDGDGEKNSAGDGQSGNERSEQSGNGDGGENPAGATADDGEKNPAAPGGGNGSERTARHSDGRTDAMLDGYSAAPDKGKDARASLDRAPGNSYKEQEFRSELASSRGMVKDRKERTTNDLLDEATRALVRGSVGPVLQSVLQTQTVAPVTTGYSGRRLEGRRLSRVAVGDGRIFSTRTVTRRADTEVIFLLDLSGSMCGEVRDYASVMFGLVDAVRNMRGFTVKAYGYSTNHLAPLGGVYVPQATSCTPTAAAAFYASRRFSGHRNRRVLIVFTDGSPDSPAAWTKVSADIRREGIEVYAIGLGFDSAHPEDIPSMLKEPTSATVKDHTELPAVVRDLFTRNLIIQ